MENSEVEKGIVVFNGRNYLNHNEFLRAELNNKKYKYIINDNDQIALDNFYNQIQNINLHIKKEIETVSHSKLDNEPEYWRRILGIKDKTFLQWVNFYISTSICYFENRIAIEKLQRPVLLGEDIPYSIVKDLLLKINNAMFNKIQKKSYSESHSLLVNIRI